MLEVPGQKIAEVFSFKTAKFGGNSKDSKISQKVEISSSQSFNDSDSEDQEMIQSSSDESELISEEQ